MEQLDACISEQCVGCRFRSSLDICRNDALQSVWWRPAAANISVVAALLGPAAAFALSKGMMHACRNSVLESSGALLHDTAMPAGLCLLGVAQSGRVMLIALMQVPAQPRHAV